jgi:hypothetical protein
VEDSGVSPVPAVERWSYGAFRQDHESESVTVPVVRDDGESAEFTVPKFVEDPADLRAIAIVVIEAFEKWEPYRGWVRDPFPGCELGPARARSERRPQGLRTASAFSTL